MTTVTIDTHTKTYDVRVGQGLLDKAGELTSSVLSFTGETPRSVCVVSDDNVFPLYGERLKGSMESAGFRVFPFVFPHGEKSKRLDVYEKLAERLAQECFTRSDVVVTLGGGVAGDLAGFAASTMLRGTAFVQIPTSLLAAVDASVGGKTALDLASGKNLIGSFYQPDLVLCDTGVFATLPEKEIRNGCAEIIKYAMLDDPALCRELLERHVRNDYEAVVAACVRKKKSYVEQDVNDFGVRHMLNFGHTFGHAIESLSGYAIPHGEAVAAGMAIASRAACAKGFCGPETPAYMEAVLKAYGLPTSTDFPASLLAAEAKKDKKASGDVVNIIIPVEVGRCEMLCIGKEELEDWFRAGGCR